MGVLGEVGVDGVAGAGDPPLDMGLTGADMRGGAGAAEVPDAPGIPGIAGGGVANSPPNSGFKTESGLRDGADGVAALDATTSGTDDCAVSGVSMGALGWTEFVPSNGTLSTARTPDSISGRLSGACCSTVLLLGMNAGFCSREMPVSSCRSSDLRLSGEGTSGECEEISDPAVSTSEIFSLRIAVIPSLIAADLASSGMSSFVLIQSRIFVAISTF